MGYVAMPGDKQVIDSDHLIALKQSLQDYAVLARVDEYVIAMDDRRKQLPMDDLLDCKMSGVEVTDVLTFFERETGKIRLDLLNPGWMIFSDGFSQDFVREFSKRTFDIAASLFLLMLAWPVMVVTMLAICMERGGCRGPVFYRQVRIGQNGKPFKMLKFRSMAVDAEKPGQIQWAQADDKRVTRIGAFIRRLRIDELPQIFNVLKGEMSFVGPRPERPQFVTQLSENIPYYHERHRVKPGISGWAQLCYPYGSSEKDAREKLQYDLYYVKNHSLFLDLTVMLHTAEVVLFGKGAR
jgi:sugar transferase (PEP-CTERM system associated)